jgi:hypothetical protein
MNGFPIVGLAKHGSERYYSYVLGPGRIFMAVITTKLSLPIFLSNPQKN